MPAGNKCGGDCCARPCRSRRQADALATIRRTFRSSSASSRSIHFDQTFHLKLANDVNSAANSRCWLRQRHPVRGPRHLFTRSPIEPSALVLDRNRPFAQRWRIDKERVGCVRCSRYGKSQRPAVRDARKLHVSLRFAQIGLTSRRCKTKVEEPGPRVRPGSFCPPAHAQRCTGRYDRTPQSAGRQ